MSLDKFDVADNVDLTQVLQVWSGAYQTAQYNNTLKRYCGHGNDDLQEFEMSYEMRYDKKPTLVKSVQQLKPKNATSRGRLPPLARTHSNSSSHGPCSDSFDGCAATSDPDKPANTRYISYLRHVVTLKTSCATVARSFPVSCRKSTVRVQQHTEEMSGLMQSRGLSANRGKASPGGSPERGARFLRCSYL